VRCQNSIASMQVDGDVGSPGTQFCGSLPHPLYLSVLFSLFEYYTTYEHDF